VWFEHTIRDQLALGRTDQAALVFQRRINRCTPGRFHTRARSPAVDPAIQIHYKHPKGKQHYLMTAGNRRDFRIGRLLNDANWDALLAIGHQTHKRLLAAPLERLPMRRRRRRAPARRAAVHPRRPAAPGLRFRRPPRDGRALLPMRLHAHHRRIHQPHPARADRRTDPRLQRAPATYDLRRLRSKGLIRRLLHSQRYQLTRDRRRLAVFFTKTAPAARRG
jgi:hypothetical protein